VVVARPTALVVAAPAAKP